MLRVLKHYNSFTKGIQTNNYCMQASLLHVHCTYMYNNVHVNYVLQWIFVGIPLVNTFLSYRCVSVLKLQMVKWGKLSITTTDMPTRRGTAKRRMSSLNTYAAWPLTPAARWGAWTRAYPSTDRVGGSPGAFLHETMLKSIAMEITLAECGDRVL